MKQTRVMYIVKQITSGVRDYQIMDNLTNRVIARVFDESLAYAIVDDLNSGKLPSVGAVRVLRLING